MQSCSDYLDSDYVFKNRETIDVSIRNVSLADGEEGCCVAFRLPDHYDYAL